MSPAPPDLASIARHVKSAQDEVRQIELLTSRYPRFDVPTAYAVARRVHEMRLAEGDVPAGRKIGFTNSALWERYRVREPIWGHMYERTVVHAAGGRVQCDLARFTEPRIEPEIVLHLCSTPPPGADLAAILDCIDWVAHAFEIVQSHFAGWRFEAADTIADGALHGALLLGEPQPVARLGHDPGAALRSFSLALRCDGHLRETGQGSNVLGSPLAALAHLLAVLAGQPHQAPLAAGEMVTTGTLTAAFAVRAGETWHTELQGIAVPALRVTFSGTPPAQAIA